MKRNFKYIFNTVIPLFIGILIGYLLIEFIIKPNIEPAKPEHKPAYIIYFWDKSKVGNKLYCDSFQFKNPYWLEYWYKGRKIQLASIKPIGVDSRED